jgi:glycerol-3-phosphate O-acyltransferase
LAQRLSILFESNSPDSFDKTLFSGFVVTLEQQGYLYTNSEGRICFGELLNNMAAQANLVLSKDTQQTIDHITNLSVAEVSEAMVALQAKSKKRKGS